MKKHTYGRIKIRMPSLDLDGAIEECRKEMYQVLGTLESRFAKAIARAAYSGGRGEATGRLGDPATWEGHVHVTPGPRGVAIETDDYREIHPALSGIEEQEKNVTGVTMVIPIYDSIPAMRALRYRDGEDLPRDWYKDLKRNEDYIVTNFRKARRANPFIAEALEEEIYNKAYYMVGLGDRMARAYVEGLLK